MQTPHAIAAEIASIIQTTPPYLRHSMARAYELVNTPGQQQAIIDALPDFGVSAVEALGLYTAIFSALSAVGIAGDLSAPNPAVFVVGEGGGVTYQEPDTE